MLVETKKEHYVPRCYLKNFSSTPEHINVFDKHKMQIRLNQKLLDVAMENHFYDLDFDSIFNKATLEEQEKITQDLKQILETENIEETIRQLDGSQHIEKQFFSTLEGVYSNLLQNIIKKSYGGNTWVMKNCRAFSAEEKDLLAFFIAIQIIRTKSFRESLSSTYEQFVQALAYKTQMCEEDALPRDAFAVSVNKDYIKLEHSGMILDPDMAVDFANAIRQHIWVMYVNKTDTPFYTSDDPVVNIPHKHDRFISYSGLSSDGIEIIFPISPMLLLGMYDAKTYSTLFADKSFMQADIELVEYFNRAQIIHCQRCVFSCSDDFAFAEQICTENPEFRTFTPYIEVL